MAIVKLVKMKEHHINQVLALEKVCFSIPWSYKSFKTDVLNESTKYICAILDNKIIGYCGMWYVLDECHITKIAVDPEYRKKGIGTALMDTILNIAKNLGAVKCTLEVRVSNLNAQNLYKKYDFTSEGIRKGYYVDNGEDALVMLKKFV